MFDSFSMHGEKLASLNGRDRIEESERTFTMKQSCNARAFPFPNSIGACGHVDVPPLAS
jgi:hypothetical protein